MGPEDSSPFVDGMLAHPLAQGFADSRRRLEELFGSLRLGATNGYAPIAISDGGNLMYRDGSRTVTIDAFCVVGTAELVYGCPARIGRKMIADTPTFSGDDAKRLNAFLRSAKREPFVRETYVKEPCPLTLIAALAMTTAPDAEDTILRATYPLMFVGSTTAPMQWSVDNAIYQKTGLLGLWRRSSREEWLKS